MTLAERRLREYCGDDRRFYVSADVTPQLDQTAQALHAEVFTTDGSQIETAVDFTSALMEAGQELRTGRSAPTS
jgi:hypothetical protein